MDLLVTCNDLDLQLYSHAKKIADDQARKVPQSGWNVQSAVSKLCEREIYRRPQSNFKIDIAGAMPGLGWYEPETNGNGYQRWTGPYKQFGLDIPLPVDGHYRATLKFYSMRDIVPGAFTVKAEDLLLPVQLTQNDKSYTAIFDIPQFHLAAKNGIAQLIFEIPSVFRPADTGLPDRRTLGVIVSSVSFKTIALKANGGRSPFSQGRAPRATTTWWRRCPSVSRHAGASQPAATRHRPDRSCCGARSPEAKGLGPVDNKIADRR